jgi:hypothetical protein
MCTDPSQITASVVGGNGSDSGPPPDVSTAVGFLMAMGLPRKRAEETAKNEDLVATLKTLVTKIGNIGSIDKAKGVLLYDIATKGASFAAQEAVGDLALKNTSPLYGCVQYRSA